MPTADEQREHDERNRAATRMLWESLQRRVDDLEQQGGSSLTAGFGGKWVKIRGAALVAILAAAAVVGVSLWDHRRLEASILGLRSDYKLSTCVMTMTPDERIEMRVRLAGRVTLEVREAMISYCPWLEREVIK